MLCPTIFLSLSFCLQELLIFLLLFIYKKKEKEKEKKRVNFMKVWVKVFAIKVHFTASRLSP
jgi:cytochrome bd-type quinol oxidase subunit 1